MSVTYHNENLDELILNLDRGEKSVLKEHSLSLRYRGLQRLGVACMKLYALYDPTPKQQQELEKRSARYTQHKSILHEKLNAQVRKKYNNPCMFVRFDNIGSIVEDPEAIRASAILLARAQSHSDWEEF